MSADDCDLFRGRFRLIRLWLLLPLSLTGCGVDSGPKATMPDTTVRVRVSDDLISVQGGIPGERLDGSFSLPAGLEELVSVLGEPDRTIDQPESQVLVWDEHGVTASRQTEADPIHTVTFCYHELGLIYNPRHKFSGEVTIRDHTLTPLASVPELKAHGYVRPTMLPVYEYSQSLGDLKVMLLNGEFDQEEFIKQIVILIPKEKRAAAKN